MRAAPSPEFGLCSGGWVPTCWCQGGNEPAAGPSPLGPPGEVLVGEALLGASSRFLAAGPGGVGEKVRTAGASALAPCAPPSLRPRAGRKRV